eukprot:3713389-Rhodomonas_salina.3
MHHKLDSQLAQPGPSTGSFWAHPFPLSSSDLLSRCQSPVPSSTSPAHNNTQHQQQCTPSARFLLAFGIRSSTPGSSNTSNPATSPRPGPKLLESVEVAGVEAVACCTHLRAAGLTQSNSEFGGRAEAVCIMIARDSDLTRPSRACPATLNSGLHQW